MREVTDVEHAISFTPALPEAESQFSRIAPGFTLIGQHGSNFGQRLCNTFVDLFLRKRGPIVLIGSDSPSVPSLHIVEAFQRLSNANVDVVLGPAVDGGYYLLGLKEPQATLFEGISWGTAAVAAETRAQAARGKLNLIEVPNWYDLDTEDDLRRLAADVSSTDDNRARETRAFVKKLLPR